MPGGRKPLRPGLNSPEMRAAIAAVCKLYGLSRRLLLKKSRHPTVLLGQQLVLKLLKDAGFSYREVAEMSGKDPRNVQRSINRLHKTMEKESILKDEYDLLSGWYAVNLPQEET